MKDQDKTKKQLIDGLVDLRHSEEYFRALIESVLDVIFILEANGAFRYASPSISEVIGCPPGELIGKDSFNYIYPQDLAKALEVFEEVLQRPGTTTKLEFRIWHRDGLLRDIEAIARNLLNVSAVKGIIVNARDITKRKTGNKR